METSRTTDVIPDEGPGTRLGHYELLEPLGQGGFGTVWRARQHAPVRRDVALKILKAGMDTVEVMARFDAERQALALMDHPGIAQVYDAGATERGRPYFVMELVEGRPLHAWCDEQRLSLEERLGLFRRICLAVQHAHGKGIVHRDLKPGNVLVVERDGEALPKVIDFGIAKAIHRPLGGVEDMLTEEGAILGTPAYMSPEQATDDSRVDTRSDVYSLGVMLYELITGSSPFDWRELRAGGTDALLRVVREVDPPRPSTRLQSLAGQATPVAALRRLDPASLRRRLSGDLDWIVMRALEKDPERRYATASELAADVQRHLDQEPVAAGPPGRAYRLSRFVRRNRGLVTAAALLMLALLAGLGGTLHGLARAERQAEISNALNTFLTEDLLGALDPEALGRAVTLREAVDTAAGALEERFAGAPLVEAAACATLGRVYSTLREHHVAVEFHQRAAELFEQELGSTAPQTLENRLALGLDLIDVARNTEAEALLLDLLDHAETADAPDELMRLDVLSGLAMLRREQGRYDESLSLFEASLDGITRRFGADSLEAANTRNDLGLLLSDMGRLELAREELEQSLAVRREGGRLDDPDSISTAGNLARLLNTMSFYAEARVLAEETLERARRVFGEDSAATHLVSNALAVSLLELGESERALQLIEEAAEALGRIQGPAHVNTLTMRRNAIAAMERLGRSRDALDRYASLQHDLEQALGVDHPQCLQNLNSRAVTLWQLGDTATAIPLFEQLVEQGDRVLGPAHPDTLIFRENMAGAYSTHGDEARAWEILEGVLAGRMESLGQDSPKVTHTLSNMAMVRQRMRDYAQAAALLDVVVDRRRVRHGEAHPALANDLEQLAWSLRQQGRWEPALAAYEEAWSTGLAAFGEGSDVTRGLAQQALEAVRGWTTAAPGRDLSAELARWSERAGS